MQTSLSRPLLLASASPRRAGLLTQLGLAFEIIPTHVAEPLPLPGADIKDWASETARLKARACVIQAHPTQPTIILGADTAVLRPDDADTLAPRWDGRPVEVMGKPTDAQDAWRMLRALAGQTHTVISAVALLAYPEGEIVSDVVATQVAFRRLTDAEIAWYLQTGEPCDKAGGYGIQGAGAVLIDSIIGDYYTVVGLPLARLWTLLAPWRV